MSQSLRVKLLSLPVCAGLVSLLTLCVSCNQAAEESSPEEIADYIEAFSAGTVRATDSIIIEFKDGIISEGELPKDMMRFSPKLKGEERWDAAAGRLEFIPEKGPLKAGDHYTCTVRLGKVIDGAKDFVFSFKVAERAAELEITETRISAEDPKTAIARGTLTLSEAVGDGVVTEGLFKTSTSWKTPVTLTRSADDSFEFEISGLRRSEAGTAAVKLYFDAPAIGFGEKVSTSITIPGRKQFKLLSADRVEASEPYVIVRFSEPLDENQSLDGLIYLEEAETARLEKDGTCAKLFYDDSRASTLTLKVERNLKSSGGTALGVEYARTFRQEGIPPAVELMISDGILPDGNKLKLPFKAVNLCAVDVNVIKIYRSNVLSFYQENSIDGTSELRRYGRLVKKYTARLDGDASRNLHQWQNFSIDLGGLFRQEKGAIYRIKLSFKQEYSLYNKDEGPKTLPPAAITPWEQSKWDEAYGWYYSWDDYHTNEWNWSDRDNPEKPSYYQDDSKFPELNLAASDIGVIVKSADESRLWVTVADIVSSRPMEGVKVTAYNYQLQKVGEGLSGENGFADFTVSGKPFIIQAEKGNAVTHLKIRGGSHEKSLSRFDVGGKKITRGLKGYVYGERGVWRPGDTLHLTLVVEDKLHALPAAHPATMDLYTPEGQIFDSKTLRGGKDGFYAFEAATAPDSPTGTWSAVFSVGGAEFKKAVPIETIKPNRLKINLSTGSETLVSGQQASMDIASHWLTGPVAADLDGTLEIVLHNTTLPFPEYRSYSFSNPLKSYSSETLSRIPFRLDSLGRATVKEDMPQAQDAPGMLKADIICKIAEPGGNTSVVANTVRFSPYTHYVGVGLQEEDYETDKDIAIKVVSVDAEGKPSAGRTLEYKIYRLSWNWWWECSASALDRYVNGKTAELEKSGTLKSTAGFTTIPFRLEYPDYGKFLLLVTDKESGHTSGGTFFVDWPLWRGHSDKSDPEALSMLSFTTDKHSYEVGETATVYLPASEGGHALVSFENASGVISRNWVATSGKQETAWKFKVTDKMAPNFYVHITLLQPHRQTVNDLPIRMYGVQNLTVNNPASHLTPVIDCPDAVRPQTPFNIRVKEEKGRAMTYTLAIVDEGLLDLTAFRTPDPWPAMNEREALGVRTWDMYDDVIGAYAGKFTSVLSIGGDMAIRGSKKENRFRPVVKFLGPFTLSGGTATHKIDLPMYVGSVRVMVVAGHAGAYGSAEKSVIVRSPLMLLTTLPRRLAPGESVRMPVNVFAMEGGAKDVSVKVEVKGPVQIDGSASQTVHFSENGDKLISFALKTDASGQGPATITVRAESGSFKAHETVHIDVVNPNPPKRESYTRLLAPGEKAGFSWKAYRPGEEESALLEISSFPSIDFSDTFDFVKYYRHLCTEQLSSRAFFLLYARDLLSPEDKAKADEILPGILEQLKTRQRPDGGFSYWPESNYSQPWATSMAGEVLMEARRQGFPVQQRCIDGWVSFQKKSVKDYRHRETYNLSDLDQAYRLYTLALAKAPDFGAMNRLKESSSLCLQARWRLAEAYAVAGKKETASQLTDASSLSIATPSSGLGNTWWSAARDKAMIAESLVETGNVGKALALAGEIAEGFSAKHASTQEIAWVSKAMATLSKVVGNGLADVRFYQRQDEVFEVTGAGALVQRKLDFAIGEAHVENRSNSTVYAHLTVRERVAAGQKVAPAASGVKVSVSYRTLSGESLDVSSLAQGTEFRADITVADLTGTAASGSMALSFSAPSGWEIWNDRLFGGGADAQCEYRDIRDDSVRWYFSLGAGEVKHFSIRLQAAYEGTFLLPEIVCEDMYNPDYKSNTANATVHVVK